MKDDSTKKSKLSWSKNLVRRWFNIKSKSQDFHADDDVMGGGEEWRPSFSEREACTVKKSRTGPERLSTRHSDGVRRARLDIDPGQITDVQDYRIFVATWNVGGRSPPRHLDLEDWLHTSPPADIYVLGFQEIVPLNAVNVLGTEDNGPAKKWVVLIRKMLNNLPGTNGSGSFHTPSPVPDPIVELDADFEGSSSRQSASSFFHRRSFQSLSRSLRMDEDFIVPQPRLDRRFSVCDRVIYGSRPSDCDANCRWVGFDEDENPGADSPGNIIYSPIPSVYSTRTSLEERERSALESRYCLVASKQMVGIFLTVWVRREIKDDVRNMKVSCVGRGLMGYLGNKGSISISMLLHRTSFCFVCTHLTSGQKEGDELRRNSDVMEILRKTRFPPVRGVGDGRSPEAILDHDRIIWLGDLNYRIALSYRTVKALVEMHNWRVLLENDQLHVERRSGRVFVGWNEGRIYFPPTYKYSTNSDRYAGDDMYAKEKRRTPAWCDRILWCGSSLNQLSYVRGNSRFSDHRPVYSIFTAQVESVSNNKAKKNIGCLSSRVEVEELLPYSCGYTELSFF